MAFLNTKFIKDLSDMRYEIVEFHGELDASTLKSTEDRLTDYLKSAESPVIIFDFTDLSFINSDGIGFIVTIYAKLMKKKQQFMLVGLKEHVADVCEAIGLPTLIKVFPTARAAIASIKI